MGITIYYRGSIEELSLIEPIQQQMVEFCQSMNWKYQLWDEDFNKPFNAKLIHHGEQRVEIKGHIPLKGITIQSDPNNETLDLLFNPAGKLSSFMGEILIHEGTLTEEQNWQFVKTQFGTVDAHIAIIKLLRLLKQGYIPNLEVRDEGEYWETADREHLIAKRAFLFGKMTQVKKALAAITFDHEPTTEEFAEKVEEVLRKIMGKRK